MKKQLLTPLLLASLLLTGCNVGSKTRVMINYKDEDSLISISRADYDYLINTKQDFILYGGQDGCSACREFKPLLLSYLQQNSLFAYYLDFSVLSSKYTNPQWLLWAELATDYPEHFKDLVGTPYIGFYREGNYVRTLNRSKYSGNAFKNAMNSFTSKSHLFHLNTLTSFNDVLTKENYFMVVSLTPNDQYQPFTNFYNLAINSKLVSYLYEPKTADLSSADLEILKTSLIVYQKEKNKDPLKVSGPEAEILINQYFSLSLFDI